MTLRETINSIAPEIPCPEILEDIPVKNISDFSDNEIKSCLNSDDFPNVLVTFAMDMCEGFERGYSFKDFVLLFDKDISSNAISLRIDLSSMISWPKQKPPSLTI